MRRSTGVASGRGLRRAVTFLLPLLAVCVLASPGEADARSESASEQAIAGVLAQSTGLTPSQVTSADTCAPARPGFAHCDAQALVLRSNHARVRPEVHGGPTFTQVFPAGGRGLPSARPANAGASPPQPGTPAWLQQAYDLTYLSQTNGSSDTVAVVDVGDDPTAEADLNAFRSSFGLRSCTTANGCFKKVNESGGASPLPTMNSDWQPEESLDLDAVSALCPNCKLLLVEATSATDSDLDQGVIEAANLGANQISNSWSDNESLPISGTFTFPGTAVIAATGDSGYLGVGNDAYPAAFPGVTAAGGTTLTPATGGSSARGFTESAWSLSGGWGASSGCDLNEAPPSYQPASGCAGRAYADLSADADPDTGLMIYDSEIGGWWQYGGTSLATPLIAAYEAITGVDGTTPQWAYTDSALLNDPTTGSSGSCPPNILYICNAGPGYDGPTGIGSISGAVVAGGPGIGGPSFGDGVGNTYNSSVGSTTATLSGGVYPNGLDTTYYWQYGTTTSYGAQTGTVDVGAGQAPVVVPGSLGGLAPGTTYHYRLVAQNGDGTAYGYDSTLTTPIAPANAVAPSIGGVAVQGQTLQAYPGGWTPAGVSISYQWERSADGVSWTNIGGATASAYTVGGADAGDELRVAVSAANVAGQATAMSAAVGPVPGSTGSAPGVAPPQWTVRPQISTDPGRVGDTVTVTASRWAGPPLRSDVTQVMRCTNTCVPAGPSNPRKYTIRAADVGSVLWVKETATNAGGTTTVWSARSVGPVKSASSAAIVLSGRRAALRNSRGAALGFASVSSPSANADFGRLRAASRVLTLRRARGIAGQVWAWVCAVSGTAGGSPPECTSRFSLGARATVRLPASMTGKIRVVVVRRGS
ncbi:MAG TPA: hypothetical protein VMA96_07605 [Solirubrobacteraceae bacterium]|nr:hypothetical protein [Solirubrobacteraceae bacterium]